MKITIHYNLFNLETNKTNLRPIGGTLVEFNLSSKQLAVNKNKHKPIGGNRHDINCGYNSLDSIDGQNVPDTNNEQHKIPSGKKGRIQSPGFDYFKGRSISIDGKK